MSSSFLNNRCMTGSFAGCPDSGHEILLTDWLVSHNDWKIFFDFLRILNLRGKDRKRRLYGRWSYRGIVCNFTVRGGDRLKERKNLSHSDHNGNCSGNRSILCGKPEIGGDTGFGSLWGYPGRIFYPAVCGNLCGLLSVFPVSDDRSRRYQTYGTDRGISGDLGQCVCDWSGNDFCRCCCVLQDDKAGDGLVPAGAGCKVCSGDRNERAAYGISGIFWKRKSFAAGAVSVCGILSVFADLIKQTVPHVLQTGEETGRMYAGVWFRQGKGNERPWKRWWRFMMRTRDMRSGCLIM